jgi:hypothetical protein
MSEDYTEDKTNGPTLRLDIPIMDGIRSVIMILIGTHPAVAGSDPVLDSGPATGFLDFSS